MGLCHLEGIHSACVDSMLKNGIRIAFKERAFYNTTNICSLSSCIMYQYDY